jgi:hypothetical protein
MYFASSALRAINRPPCTSAGDKFWLVSAFRPAARPSCSDLDEAIVLHNNSTIISRRWSAMGENCDADTSSFPGAFVSHFRHCQFCRRYRSHSTGRLVRRRQPSSGRAHRPWPVGRSHRSAQRRQRRLLSRRHAYLRRQAQMQCHRVQQGTASAVNEMLLSVAIVQISGLDYNPSTVC